MGAKYNFDTKPIYLAARFVCQFWDHQKLFSTPANTSSSQPSNIPTNNSSPTGRILDSDQKLIAAKILNLPHF